MIYNEAWRGVCALYDAVYGPYKEEDVEFDGDAELESESEEEETEGEETEEEDEGDGFRDGGVDETSEECDNEEVEEDVIE